MTLDHGPPDRRTRPDLMKVASYHHRGERDIKAAQFYTGQHYRLPPMREVILAGPRRHTPSHHLGAGPSHRPLFTKFGEVRAEKTLLAVPCLASGDFIARPTAITAGTNEFVSPIPVTIMQAAFEPVPRAVRRHPARRDETLSNRTANVLRTRPEIKGTCPSQQAPLSSAS